MAFARIVAAVWLAVASAAGAETLEYDLRLGAVKVGLLQLQVIRGEGYQARLAIRSTRLAGVVRAVRFEATAEGAPGPAPARYRETADTGRRESEVVLEWDGGLPMVLSYRASPPDVTPPAAPAAGALDPASAFLAAMIRPAGAPCALDFAVFDGQRLSQVTLAGGQGDCRGSFRRIAGYRPDEMEERRDFPLRLTYAETPDGRVLDEAEVQTLYGKVRLKRR